VRASVKQSDLAKPTRAPESASLTPTPRRKVETPSARPAGEDSDVEDLAARAASLEERILARVEQALRAKGISRD